MNETVAVDEKERQSVLSREFDLIVETLGRTSDTVTEAKIKESRQYKYRISDSPDDIRHVKQRLVESGAVTSSATPIQQVDYYFLQPGARPTYVEEVLCFRSEEPFHNQAEEGDRLEDLPLYSLVYKTNAHRSDYRNHQRTVRYMVTTEQDSAVRLLEAIDAVQGSDAVVPYEVHKIRTVYEYPVARTGFSVRIYVDEHVTRSAPHEEESAYVGNYLEFTIPDELFGLIDIDDIQRQLGLESSESVEIPYIAMDARALGKGALTRIETEFDPEEYRKWRRCEYIPYYFSGAVGEFVLGVNARDCGQESVEAVENEVRRINEDIVKYGGEDGLPMRSSGGGAGSDVYERLPHHDALKRFPSIADKLDDVRLYRRDWSQSKRGSKRLLFSTARIKGSDRRILLVHDVLPHLSYQNEWLPAHKSS